MNELKECPFCGINDWQYQSHFSGATVYQCGGCGTIVDESIINNRPIEDVLTAHIAKLEDENRLYAKDNSAMQIAVDKFYRRAVDAEARVIELKSELANRTQKLMDSEVRIADLELLNLGSKKESER